MALDPKIAALKSSGVYRFEFDKSQTISIPAEQIRMVVGFSKKGPFNTPIYVSDSGYFIDVFGNIDRSMERKNSYFHRTCLGALERGPILALNLLRLNNEDTESFDMDVVQDLSYSASATTVNDTVASDKYSGFFNTNKYWYPDADSFLSNINPTLNTNKLFNLVNIGNTAISVIVRKADPSSLKGFDITAKEWYGMAQVPSYLHADDYISDFFIDVIVIGGNWGPDSNLYQRFASDPMFASYFHQTKGIIRKLNSLTDTTDTSLATFLSLPEIQHIATYTGCLLPDFIDLNGDNMFIEDLINADTAKNGLFCAINKAAFDSDELLSGTSLGIDMIGHSIEYIQPESIDFLSYKETIVSDLTYSQDGSAPSTLDLTSVTITDNSDGNIEFSGSLSAAPDFFAAVDATAFRANETGQIGTYIIDGTYALPVIAVTTTPTTAAMVVSPGTSGLVASDFTTSTTYLNYTALDFVVDGNDSTPLPLGTIQGGPESTLYTAVHNGTVTTGDKIIWDETSTGVYADATLGYIVAETTTSTNIVYASGGSYYDLTIVDTDYPINVANIIAFTTTTFDIGSEISIDLTEAYFDTAQDLGTVGDLIIQTLKGSLNTTVPATAVSGVSNIVTVAAAYSSYLSVGDYLLQNAGSSTEPSRLTRITKISAAAGTGILTVTTVGKILLSTINSIVTIEVYKPIEKWTDYYTIAGLNGFTHNPLYHVPDGTQTRQDDIINDVLSGTNLFNALVDRDNITFRYLVDSFGLGVQANSKRLFAYLCKTRGNALAILNAPSLKDFKESTNPSFLDLQGAVSTRMISEGGNLTLNPTTTYSLPSVADGSSYCVFYAPYIAVRDRGKNILIPPAAYVSNDYIDKYANALPWSIVAGPRRGVISGRGVVGLEYNFSKVDRDYLEPFGINPIVMQSGSGIVIMANKTAQQNVKSALSSAHVREVLIYVEDGMAAILKNFIFEFNTAQTRLEIKTLADNFMKRVQSDSGVYAFRNIMDETNNTPDVIDMNMGIIDTYLEPIKGLEIIVHRTTVLKTGTIATGQYL